MAEERLSDIRERHAAGLFAVRLLPRFSDTLSPASLVSIVCSCDFLHALIALIASESKYNIAYPLIRSVLSAYYIFLGKFRLMASATKKA